MRPRPGLLEFCGGALIALGVLTPIASAALIAVMTVAVITVHYAKGLWARGGGYEYNLVLGAVAFTLAAIGPGYRSLDHALSFSMHGVIWGIGALVVGVVGGVGAVIGARMADRRQRAVPTERATPA